MPVKKETIETTSVIYKLTVDVINEAIKSYLEKEHSAGFTSDTIINYDFGKSPLTCEVITTWGNKKEEKP